MENKDPQFKLLEFLEETGIAKERNISEFIVENFVKPTVRVSNEDDKGVQFLQSIMRRELIRYNTGQLGNVNNRFISTNPNLDDLPKWFDEEPIMGNITLGGLEYLYQRKMNNSIVSANDIISQNSTTQSRILTRQTWILGIVGLFALVSMIVSIKMYKLDNKTQQLSTHIEQLKQDSLKSQKELFQLKILYTKMNADSSSKRSHTQIKKNGR